MTVRTFTDTRESDILIETILDEIGNSVDQTLDQSLPKLNLRLKSPGLLTLSGLVLTIGNTTITTGPNGRKSGLPPVNGIDLNNLAGTYNFSNAAITGNVAASALPTLAANLFYRAGVEIRTDKTINIVFGAGAALAVNAGIPAFSSGTVRLGEVLLQANAGGTAFVAPTTNSAITQFGTGSGGGGSGSGLGIINYVENYDAEVNVDGWSLYKDAANGLPVDGTGGTATALTFTRTLASATPPGLIGAAYFRLVKNTGTNAQGEGVSNRLLPVDPIYRDKVLVVKGLGAWSQYFSVYLYDIDTSALISPLTPQPIAGQLLSRVAFKLNGSTNYRLILHYNSALTAPAVDLRFDQVTFSFENPTPKLSDFATPTAHGFTIGNVVVRDASNVWSKALATDVNALSAVFVTQILDANNFEFVIDGIVTGVVGNASGYLYASDTVAGALTAVAPSDGVPLLFGYGDGTALVIQRAPAISRAFAPISFPSGTTLKIGHGYLKLSNGEELVTGSGTSLTTLDKDITLNLATLVGATGTASTLYWLYVDRFSLGQPITISNNGRRARVVTDETHFALTTTKPEQMDVYRYIPVGWIFTGTAGEWSLNGAAFGTPAAKQHDVLSDATSVPKRYRSQTITANTTVTTLTHGLGARPQFVTIEYYSSASQTFRPLSTEYLITSISETQIVIDPRGLPSFTAGDFLDVQAIAFSPAYDHIATPATEFVSSWLTSTLTVELMHLLSDDEDILGVSVIEWDVTLNTKRLIDPQALVTKFDATKIYLDWSGLTPSSTLRYRVTAGRSSARNAIPVKIGGFNKFVGNGPGAYATFFDMLTALTAGDRVLVNTDVSISGLTTISANDVEIHFMPNTSMTIPSGAQLELTAGRIHLIRPTFLVTAANANPVRISGSENEIVRARLIATSGVTTAGFAIASGAQRNYVQGCATATGGTLTNKITDAGTDSDFSVR